ncbi:hypothetical protein BCR44DRAFT_303009 [Catenaria anguillulae PL171]|uniref:Secreted protein n=1 Tax=Catenaria anguillulae PL171 TaxID=765915 RepID=A0A1Y2HT39_9FUNG|nr:hypothetical protein BCR44DRAFT_303009 [Catenaria anguillulae PL171]
MPSMAPGLNFRLAGICWVTCPAIYASAVQISAAGWSQSFRRAEPRVRRLLVGFQTSRETPWAATRRPSTDSRWLVPRSQRWSASGALPSVLIVTVGKIRNNTGPPPATTSRFTVAMTSIRCWRPLSPAQPRLVSHNYGPTRDASDQAHGADTP